MRYTTRAEDLPPSKIPNGYEPCESGPQKYCTPGRNQPVSSTWTPYYIPRFSGYGCYGEELEERKARLATYGGKKWIATFGDMLMDLETFFGHKIEQGKTFIQENDKRVLDYELAYDKPEDFFSSRNPFNPYLDSDSFYNSHPLVEQARRGECNFPSSKSIEELDYLEMHRLRLRVIETLRSINPPDGVEKLEIPEDLLIGERVRAGIQNILHGQDPKTYGVLYLPRSCGSKPRQIYLPNYNALVKSINEDFPKSPQAVY
jgi:hypothetical protein